MQADLQSECTNKGSIVTNGAAQLLQRKKIYFGLFVNSVRLSYQKTIFFTHSYLNRKLFTPGCLHGHCCRFDRVNLTGRYKKLQLDDGSDQIQKTIAAFSDN